MTAHAGHPLQQASDSSVRRAPDLPAVFVGVGVEVASTTSANEPVAPLVSANYLPRDDFEPSVLGVS
jgi:hypothetical protein